MRSNEAAGPRVEYRRSNLKELLSNVDGDDSDWFSVNTRAGQPSDFILYPQLPTLQLGQLEIVRRWMLKRFGQFRFKHPVALFEFCEMRRCSHSRVSLGVRWTSDDSFVTRF